MSADTRAALPTPAERTNEDLLELHGQLHARLCAHPCAEAVHATYAAAKDELLKRLARAAQLEEALVALDDTCDEVVGALTHAVYEAMLDAGMEDALDALDSARRDAVSLIQHTEAFRPVQEKRYARIRSLTTEGGDRADTH